MKTALAYLAAAVVILGIIGFAVGWLQWNDEGDHSSLRVETQALNEAGEKTSKAAADALEEVGDAVRAGGRELEKATDELQNDAARDTAVDSRP